MSVATNAGRLDALNGLRFLAAAAVALAHMPHLHAYPSLREAVVLSTLRGGLITFFFILSGCVFAYRYHAKLAQPTRADLTDYYRSRVARIWPVHIFALTLALLVPISPYAATWGSFVANAFLVHTWVPRPEYYNGYNSVTWTLGPEAFFFLILPLILMGVAKRPLSNRGLVQAMIGVWIVNASFVYWHATHLGNWSLYLCVMCPLARLGEFVIGLGVGLLITREHGITHRTWRGTVIELAAVIGPLMLAAVTKRVPELLWHNGLFTPMLAFAVWTFARQRGHLSTLLSLKSLVYLGTLSYPLYLLHPFAITLGNRWLTPLDGYPVIWAAILLSLATLAATIVHHAIEVPGQRLLGPRRHPKVVPLSMPTPLAKAA